MKHIPILIAALMLLPVFAKAQTADPELEYIKSTYSKEKKTIVDEYMGLNVQDGAKFWKIYGEYEARREKLAVQRVKLIDEYVEKADGINAATADKIATAALTNTINLDRLNLEIYNKIKKDLGAVKAAKFIQLEIYLQTAWRVVVQDYIPLISELDKTSKKQ